MSDYKLSNFRAFCISNKIAYNTACVYASAVRRWLQDMEVTTPEEFAEEQFTIAHVLPTAWRWFGRYAESIQADITTFPSPLLGQKQRFPVPRHLAHQIGQFAWKFGWEAEQIFGKRLHQIVDVRDGILGVVCPTLNAFITDPQGLTDLGIVVTWGYGLDTWRLVQDNETFALTEYPLLPERPGSKTPMSVKKVAALIVMEEKLRGWTTG